MLRLTVLFLFLLFQTSILFAQSPKARYELGGSLGAFMYKGDYSAESYVISAASPAASFHYRKTIGKKYHHWAYQWALNGGLLQIADKQASDPFNQQRDFSEKGIVAELSFTLDYQFLDFRNGHYRWTPYLTGGLGLGKVFYFKNFNSFVPMHANLHPVIPFGIGLKYALASRWDIGACFVARKTFTDQFEDYTPDPLVEPTPKFERINPSTKDQYGFLSLTLTYRIESVICPD